LTPVSGKRNVERLDYQKLYEVSPFSWYEVWNTILWFYMHGLLFLFEVGYNFVNRTRKKFWHFSNGMNARLQEWVQCQIYLSLLLFFSSPDILDSYFPIVGNIPQWY
jgi:hypothetical protein